MSLLRVDFTGKPHVLAWLKELENAGHLEHYLQVLYECNAEPWYANRVLVLESEVAPVRDIKRVRAGWEDAIQHCGTKDGEKVQ